VKGSYSTGAGFVLPRLFEKIRQVVGLNREQFRDCFRIGKKGRLTPYEPNLANLGAFQLLHARKVVVPATLLTPDPPNGLCVPLGGPIGVGMKVM